MSACQQRICGCFPNISGKGTGITGFDFDLSVIFIGALAATTSAGEGIKSTSASSNKVSPIWLVAALTNTGA
jgi:hypothetical protein